MPDNHEHNITPEEFRKMNPDEKIVKMANGLIPPKGQPSHEVLDSLLHKIEKTKPARSIRMKRYLQAIAALILLFIGLKIVPDLVASQKHSTTYAQQSEIELPDGTKVFLNADSKIEWNNKKFTVKREVKLKGEAYFDVKKGEEFIINTKNGSIEILGTQLNIFSRNNAFWVSCLEGKVRVTSENQQHTITSNEWVRLNDSKLVKSKSEIIENSISWKDGICHFEETSLEIIFAEIERQYNINVVFNGDKSRKATIDFVTTNLEEALEVVCSPMELAYELTNKKKVIISEK